MPPKFKFKKEEIIEACFQLAKKDGLKAVTARGVAAELNSSSKVIFSSFKDMEEVKSAVIERAKAEYKTYVDEGLKDVLPFRGVGMNYIKFAKNQPKLFRMLFMEEVAPNERMAGAMHLDESYQRILECVERSYGLNRADAEEVYKCLWVSTHGFAVLQATKVCDFSESEVQGVLHNIITGVLTVMKK